MRGMRKASPEEQANLNSVRPTRYPELGYRCDGPGLWRIYDMADKGRESPVGPQYTSKAELLADLGRYAKDFGCDLS